MQHRIIPLAAVAVLLAGAQAALEFEVASVKPTDNKSNISGFPTRSGDRIAMHNTRIFSMICYAFHINGGYQLVNWDKFPGAWDWWDVDARVPADATTDQVRLMFQSLLRDRFRFQAHFETRDIAEYELTAGSGKPKLSAAAEAPAKLTIEGRTLSAPKQGCATSLWNDGGHVVCHDATVEQMATEFGGLLHSPIVNRTGIDGKYDLDLIYMPDDRRLDANAEPGPTLEQAVKSEMGLILRKSTGPVQVLVVERFEKPTEN